MPQPPAPSSRPRPRVRAKSPRTALHTRGPERSLVGSLRSWLPGHPASQWEVTSCPCTRRRSGSVRRGPGHSQGQAHLQVVGKASATAVTTVRGRGLCGHGHRHGREHRLRDPQGRGRVTARSPPQGTTESRYRCGARGLPIGSQSRPPRKAPDISSGRGEPHAGDQEARPGLPAPSVPVTGQMSKLSFRGSEGDSTPTPHGHTLGRHREARLLSRGRAFGWEPRGPSPRPGTDARPSGRLLTGHAPRSAIRISRKGRHALLNLCLHAALTFTAFAGGINRTQYPTLCQAVSAAAGPAGGGVGSPPCCERRPGCGTGALGEPSG